MSTYARDLAEDALQHHAIEPAAREVQITRLAEYIEQKIAAFLEFDQELREARAEPPAASDGSPR